MEGVIAFVRTQVCDRDAFAAMDGPALKAALAITADGDTWNTVTHHGTRAAIWRAKVHPDLDTSPGLPTIRNYQ